MPIPQLHLLDRRRLLQGSAFVGLAGLGGCATALGEPAPQPGEAAGRPRLKPIRASADRLFDITVCLRPFRAAGPRIEMERIGEALVVHNYGYGGSGWSLSWGGGAIAVAKAMEQSPREIAVVGCGAIGLTSAILAQRAGARVTIYARELLPQTRSARATGMFTPDSRIALTNAAAPGFGDVWEQMARTSFKSFRSYLGLPGTPVEWIDQYTLLDHPRGQGGGGQPAPGELDFAAYRSRIQDLLPRPEELTPETSPFEAPNAYRISQLMFNIADYGHTLLTDFLLAGGKVEIREFRSPAELGSLAEKVVINCPGYGARALMKDESVVPVRGQIGWLIPQAEVNYGLYYKEVSVVPRRDGIVVQAIEGGDMKGYGDANETIDRTESERAVETIAELFRKLRSA